MLVSSSIDNKLYFDKLETALQELQTLQDGTIFLFFKSEDGHIKEDTTQWWSWESKKNRIIKYTIISSQKK